MTLNSCSSYLPLPSAETAGTVYHAWFISYFKSYFIYLFGSLCVCVCVCVCMCVCVVYVHVHTIAQACGGQRIIF
jgi:membrane-associated phospholipid phosphatase